MPIYFIRHGQSEFNAAFDPSVGDPMIFDAPLSPLGRQQAIMARAHVAELGIERVIVSPMTRAIETALHIFETVPTIEIDPRARELLSNSCDVGRSPAELAEDFPHLSFGHMSDNWWYQGAVNEHGVACEPLDVFVQRVTEFRDWLLTQPAQTFAVVGHGNLFKALTGRMLDNCEIHTFEADGPEIYSI
jgi:broad specificity phosphatase PhoE